METRVLLVKSRSLASKTSATMPPLGLLYLAAYLRRELGASVRVIDLYFEQDEVRAVQDAVHALQPHVVGISAVTAEALVAHRLAAVLKSHQRPPTVVIGGPHASSDPEAVTQDPCVDVAVIGEGEVTFTEIVRRAVEEGSGWAEPAVLDEIHGIAYRRDGACVRTPPRSPLQDLDALPFPAWDLIDYRRYWKLAGMATVGIRPYMPIVSSRGCPYHCIYCHQSLGMRFRPRSPESIADEIVELRKRGMHEIEFVDDIANFDRDRFERILTELLQRSVHSKLSFPSGLRADLLRPESLDLLKQVGVGEVSVAVETVSPRLQKMIRKNLDLGRVEQAIGALADRRIFSRGYFLLGLPSETEDEMRATIRFAHASRLHLALFFTPTPFRNTELFQMVQRAGKMPGDVRSIDFEFFGGPFNASDVPEVVYRRLYRWAYYGFYLNPVRLARIARDRPRLSDVPAKAHNVIARLASFQRLDESGGSGSSGRARVAAEVPTEKAW
jgi:radical SAM superfamily enzyme YgiQ (UPF0313 family)